MNNKLLDSSNQSSCPNFIYDNPVLDPKVARALSKSFVNILRISQQNSNINTNLRHSVLTNIRRMCRNEPENHFNVDDTVTNLITEVYASAIEDSQSIDLDVLTEQTLDDILMKSMKELNISPKCNSSVNPETIQSLINLKPNCIDTVSKHILKLNATQLKSSALISGLWETSHLSPKIINDLSVKMKSQIELQLITLSHKFLTDSCNFEDILTIDDSLKELINKCSKSANCFQICCSILNYLLISSGYNSSLLTLIFKFVSSVKELNDTISVLYPSHLRHIVVLLDIDLDVVQNEYREKYVNQAYFYVNNLQKESESDTILLLSHFPQWFDLFFNE